MSDGKLIAEKFKNCGFLQRRIRTTILLINKKSSRGKTFSKMSSNQSNVVNESNSASMSSNVLAEAS